MGLQGAEEDRLFMSTPSISDWSSAKVQTGGRTDLTMQSHTAISLCQVSKVKVYVLLDR